ncbi:MULTISPECIES: T6SS effector BTH_I2691 family protein [Acinetobacter]|uniref:T6SS effector BTH_I2691 family protein n=1 Tax=Acinetobacter TaxID=469 RepID=UPI0002AEDA51|nr:MULTISPECIES: T6SS effector BTH_I2691 family protein [Acinetobacter]ELW86086.1 hypothetical protein ACINWC743_A0443 [Acinetobacter sp. WC-743]MBJ8424673.1 hypothetical protein [Acinetobacter bereziniae]MBJ8473825.1 hypothetical protein [Acinetobacter bereziniae]MCU4415750.1 hypothetical protein [Acinetobacter bereziniae]
MGGDKEAFARKENKKAEQRRQQEEILAAPNAITKAANAAIQVNQQTSDAKGSKDQCNFCRKLGLQILPLRYTVTRDKAPQLNSQLGKNVKNVALSYSQYTTEMIDSGYVYAMIKRKKGYEWSGYIVTPKGYLSSFPLDKPAPVSVLEFACQGNEHAVFASFVTVEYIATNLAEKAYLIYTHAPMTDKKREEYQAKADEYVSSGKWQSVDVAAWAKGTSQQQHCLNNTTLKDGISQPFSFGTDRWKQLVKKFTEKPKAFSAVVLYDPVGITIKLNEYRNEAYVPVDDYLEAKDKYGVTNQRKLDSVQRVKSIEGSLLKNKEKIVQRENEIHEQTAPAIEIRYKSNLNAIEQRLIYARKWNNTAEIEQLEQSKKLLIEEHERTMKKRAGHGEEVGEANYQTDRKVLLDHLNYKEIEAFKQEVAQKYDTALKVANQRAQEHLNWVVSESLLDALDAYDQKDLQSGCAFKAHVATMLFGMEGAEAGAKQLDDWIKKPDYERKNLFIRGLYSNQLEAKAKHEELKKAATDFTAVGIKAMKGTIDFLKKTDSAWDEWARNQGIDKNKGNIAFSKVEKKVMLYVSNFARVVFRAGMGSTAESRFVAAISQKLLFAQMGELAGKLRFDQVVYNINPEKLNSGNIKLSPEFGERVGGQLSKNTKEATMRSLDVLIDDAMAKKQQVALTLEEIEKAGSKGMVNHTNNYHQVRASGILVFLEAINLTHMLSSGKYKDNVQIAALVASVSALMAFALDIFYGLAKGVREVATQTSYGGAGAAATRGAANIQRAGIKWAAGSLSAFAGGITAWLDYKKFESLEEKNEVSKGLIVLYATRSLTGVVNVFLGVLVALTYIGPLMEYLKRVGGSPLIQKIGAKVFGETIAKYSVKKLTQEIVRNALLRVIAWASGIGLILTLAEVSFLIYREATKLQRWCQYSTFRSLKTNQLMSEQQEIEDFQTLFA